jgi:hypothetical protein
VCRQTETEMEGKYMIFLYWSQHEVWQQPAMEMGQHHWMWAVNKDFCLRQCRSNPGEECNIRMGTWEQQCKIYNNCGWWGLWQACGQARTFLPHQVNVVTMLSSYRIPCSLVDYCEVWNRDNYTTAFCKVMKVIQDTLYFSRLLWSVEKKQWYYCCVSVEFIQETLWWWRLLGGMEQKQ